MKKTLAALAMASALVLAGCGGGGDGWDDGTRQQYMDGCLESAEASGADMGVAESYCQCTLTELEKTFTVEELEQIESGDVSDQQKIEDFMAAAQSCASELQ